MGGDSAGSDGETIRTRADEKVFRRGPFVMGFTSSFRMGQLLRYSLHPPEHPAGMSGHEYMATILVDAVRECLKAGGFATKENETETGGTFLIGYRGRVYEVSSDYQVAITADGFTAVGCGAQTALGALHATGDRPPEERLQVALEAAERFCPEVRGPFVFLAEPPTLQACGRRTGTDWRRKP
jgi:hypothetical protein